MNGVILNPSEIFNFDAPGLAIPFKRHFKSILSVSITNFRVYTFYSEEERRCSEVLEFFIEEMILVVEEKNDKGDIVLVETWELKLENGSKLPPN
jgi:hypothetical protein